MSAAGLENLRDAHLHLAAHGEEMAAAHLEEATSLAEALEMLAQQADGLAPGDWVRGRGARPEGWPERRFPTRTELDEAGGGRAVVATSFDFHACAASSAALEAAGISAATPDPAGGIIGRDERGEPNGHLVEAAYGMLRSTIPAPTEEQTLEHLRAAQRDLLSYGFTEVHEMMASPGLPRLLRKLEDAGELELTVKIYATPDALPEVLRFFGDHGASDRVRPGGLKLFLDGTVNSRTAHMLEPFAEPLEGHPRGTPLVSFDELTQHFQFCKTTGVDCAVHAIGDAAVRSALDAYAMLRRPGFKLRVEHAQFIDEADIPRFAAMGVIASLQPCHLLPDVEAITRLLPHRADRAFPLRDLIDAARAAGWDPAELIYLGSDTPVVSPDPADNLRAAVERRRGDSAVIGQDQAISAEECLALMRALV